MGLTGFGIVAALFSLTMRDNLLWGLIVAAVATAAYFAPGPAPDKAAYRRCIEQHHPARYCSREHLERW
jgi:hypothetical protein